MLPDAVLMHTSLYQLMVCSRMVFVLEASVGCVHESDSGQASAGDSVPAAYKQPGNILCSLLEKLSIKTKDLLTYAWTSSLVFACGKD